MYINVYKCKKCSNYNFYIHLFTIIYIFLHLYTFSISIEGSLDQYYQKHPDQWHYNLHYFCELQTKSYILDVIGIDSTAFRFNINAAYLLFVDSIRELVKVSPITVSQFLQYNTTFTHNPFLSVIEALTHFLEQKLRIVSFRKLQKKLV